VLVTSPSPGDGKTLTSVNLALTMARAYDQTVLLADCDLKRQGVHKILGIDSYMGLQDYLVDETPLEKIIVWPGVEKISLISGGSPAVNSAEILSSPRMKELVGELKSRYADRIVLFDAPPVLSGADTLALAPLVDCIVMVVSEGKTSMKDVQRSLDVIPSDKLLGFVINRQRYDAAKAYYGYSNP
jgi:non-specific protein-tyrosine kinase